MGDKLDKFKDKFGTKSLTSLDTKTVGVLDKALEHIDKRLNEKNKSLMPGKTAYKKLQQLKEKYMLQKGKTLKIYNKYKKKNPILRSLSVSSLSVAKIYEVIGKQTKQAGKFKEAWLNDPGKVLQIAGAGLATAGALSALAGAGVPQAMWQVIAGFFANSEISIFLKLGVSAIGVGALAFAGGKLLKKHQKNKAIYHAEQYKAETEANKGTVADKDTMSAKSMDADTIKNLAAQASVDSDLMAELHAMIANPLTNPTAAENAVAILKQANTFQAKNLERSNGMLLQNKIESAANESDKIKNFSIAIYAKELAEQTKNPEQLKEEDHILLQIKEEDVKDINSFIEELNKLNDEALKSFEDFKAFKKYVTETKAADMKYDKLPKTENRNLETRINSIIQQKYNTAQARETLKNLKGRGLIDASTEINPDEEVKENEIKINGNEIGVVESEGKTAIVGLAEELDLELTGADDKAKYENLMRKYGDETGVKQALETIRKDQLKLEGTRELESE